MSTQPILLLRDGPVATIRFNRPAALNAINVDLAEAFRRVCEALAQDATVGAVALSGEGRAFMAGGDIAEMSADTARVAPRLIDEMHAGIRILAALPCPVIASVHGAVAGAGLGVALSADLCVAAESTRFTMAYPLVGASCDCATSWGLPRVVGLRKAMEISQCSQSVAATEALRLGLVNRVVPDERLSEETQQLARELAAGPRTAFARLKRLLRDSESRTLDEQLDAERAAFLECSATPDFLEGLAAFLHKRSARFGGDA
jgi:2-(1,2-epoxy-1,2-dihydrophenyl)acetyl-CoA isomerase